MQTPRLMIVVCAALLSVACFSSLATSPEAEAQKVAQAYWDSILTRCGDGYYAISKGNTLVQFQDPEIVTTTKPVDEVTRLNGIEMAGSSRVSIKAFRDHEPGMGGWQKWRRSNGFGGRTPSVSMFRQGGVWKFGSPEYQPSQPEWKAANCAKLPQESGQP